MPRYSEKAGTVNSFSTMKSAYQREQYQEYRYYLVPYLADGEIGPINLCFCVFGHYKTDLLRVGKGGNSLGS